MITRTKFLVQNNQFSYDPPRFRGITEGWRSPAERTGLENRQGRKSLMGSNPTPSAKASRVRITGTTYIRVMAMLPEIDN